MSEDQSLARSHSILPDFVHLHVWESSRVVIRPGAWELELHSPYWRLYVNKEPGAVLSYEGGEVAMLPGVIYIVPAWVAFRTSVSAPVVHHYLHFFLTGFPVDPLRALFGRPMALPPSALELALSEQWRERLSVPNDFQAFVWAHALANAVMGGLMAACSEEEQRACFYPWDEAAPLRPALELLNHRLAAPPDNGELAKACRTSTGNFVRRFRQVIGMTPAQYGLHRRVTAAAQSLAGTTLTVDAIAEATGFTDRFHLTRMFKARLGVPPAAYRRMHQRDGRVW